MITNRFRNKTVLVVGASGSVGSALSRRLIKIGVKQLFILDQDETGIFDLYQDLRNQGKIDYIMANIREWETIRDVFRKIKPDIVFHAAAYKHVVPMEKYPDEAYKTNIIGTINLIKAAQQVKVQRFIFISSDKAVNPKSVMGKTKEEGEEICLRQKSKTKFIVVRFGNVLASRGSVVPIFQKAIKENRELMVTHRNMKRFVMGIFEAVDLVLRATLIGGGGEIFVLDMGEQMYVRDLAKMMVRLSGKPIEITYGSPGPGEKFYEELMTSEESKRAKKINGMYVIEPPRR